MIQVWSATSPSPNNASLLIMRCQTHLTNVLCSAFSSLSLSMSECFTQWITHSLSLSVMGVVCLVESGSFCIIFIVTVVWMMDHFIHFNASQKSRPLHPSSNWFDVCHLAVISLPGPFLLYRWCPEHVSVCHTHSQEWLHHRHTQVSWLLVLGGAPAICRAPPGGPIVFNITTHNHSKASLEITVLIKLHCSPATAHSKPSNTLRSSTAYWNKDKRGIFREGIMSARHKGFFQSTSFFISREHFSKVTSL